VAHTLREQGFNAFVIVGGLAAWRKAGRPTEQVPASDLVLLPTFSRRPLPAEAEKRRIPKPIG
jgi:3-mercaptopyruvate sulfurtransferase SseA